MRIIILTIYITCLFNIIVFSNSYYIDSVAGSDDNRGNSSDNAWKTIAKVNEVKFQPGDSVLFKSGSIWREELKIRSSGTVEHPIYIGRYGTEENPKIIGSERISNWEKAEKNIWKSKHITNSKWVWFVDEKICWGSKVENIKYLDKNFEFFVDQKHMYIFLDKSPHRYQSIETSIRNFGIVSGWYGNPNSNIVIEGIEICFTINSNIRAVGSNNWEIKGNILHHSGAIDESDGQGIQWEGQFAKIKNNKIFENGQHGIFISSFGNHDVYSNLIEENEVYNNYHTAIDLMNDGGDSNSHRNTIIRRNMIYDEEDFLGKEIGIQTLGYGNGEVKNVVIHHNIIFELNGMGISVMGNSDSIFVHNNTIIETESACLNINNDEDYSQVINNISINNNYYAVVFIHHVNNKLFRNNYWYTEKLSETENVFIENKYTSDYSKYSHLMGGELNSSFSNPLITIESKKIIISEKSPCINKGFPMKYELDFNGGKIIDRIDVGAIEY